MSTELKNTEQAAAYIGQQPQTLAVWRSSGRYALPFLKSGRKVFYRQSDLDEWLESRVMTHTGERAGI